MTCEKLTCFAIVIDQHKEDRLLWLLEELRIGYRVQLGGYREGGLPGTAPVSPGAISDVAPY